jgi:hypothetical protein
MQVPEGLQGSDKGWLQEFLDEFEAIFFHFLLFFTNPFSSEFNAETVDC